MCANTIIAVSLNGYVLLTVCRKFHALPTRHNINSTIETTAFETRSRGVITANPVLDRFILHLSYSMSARMCPETNAHTSRVTGGEDDH